jgi:diacylglycerol kinase (ATP)
MTNEKWFVVVNPNAGHGKGKKDWERISGLLDRNGLLYSARFTQKKGEAIDFARQAAAEGYRRIASVGGDGTLNEVLNGVYTQNFCKPSEMTLGIIPVGTGNDWGRMFGIPLVYEGAIKILSEFKTLTQDVGVVTFHKGEVKDTRYFINIAGLGFEAMVVSKTNRQKDKGKSSQAIYFLNLISSLLSYRKVESEITIDGKSTRCRVFSINVGNGRYCGGGMRQTPDAVPDDGLLDITVIRDMTRFEIVKSLKLLYDGTILSHPLVDGYRTTFLKVTSEELLYAEADGESLGHTPLEFSIIPAGINVVYGVRAFQ